MASPTTENQAAGTDSRRLIAVPSGEDSTPEGAGEKLGLELVFPGLMLLGSAAYAWSLRDITNSEMNLLLLRPLFLAVWGLLLLIILREIAPALRRRAPRTKTDRQRLAQRFAPGTEALAGVVIAITVVLAAVVPGGGHLRYIGGIFVYLCVVGWLLGDRTPVSLVLRSACCAGGLYLLMGIILGVRL